MGLTADRIRKLRILKGFTQAELAKKLDIGKTAISNYEKGVSTPKKAVLSKMAKLFNVSMEFIYSEEGFKEEPDTLFFENGIKSVPIHTELSNDETYGFCYLPPRVDVNFEYCAWIVNSNYVSNNVPKGSIVIIQKNELLNDGDLAVAILKNKKTVIGYYYKASDSIFTLNPSSRDQVLNPLVINVKDTNFKLVGKVISATLKF